MKGYQNNSLCKNKSSDKKKKNQTEQSLHENSKQIREFVIYANNLEKKGIMSTNATKVTKTVNHEYCIWHLFTFSSNLLESEFEEKVNSTKRYCI